MGRAGAVAPGGDLSDVRMLDLGGMLGLKKRVDEGVHAGPGVPRDAATAVGAAGAAAGCGIGWSSGEYGGFLSQFCLSFFSPSVLS